MTTLHITDDEMASLRRIAAEASEAGQLRRGKRARRLIEIGEALATAETQFDAEVALSCTRQAIHKALDRFRRDPELLEPWGTRPASAVEPQKCRDCTELAVPGRTRCAAHLAAHRRRKADD